MANAASQMAESTVTADPNDTVAKSADNASSKSLVAASSISQAASEHWRRRNSTAMSLWHLARPLPAPTTASKN